MRPDKWYRLFRVIRAWQKRQGDCCYAYVCIKSCAEATDLAHSKGYKFMDQVMNDIDFWGVLWS